MAQSALRPVTSVNELVSLMPEASAVKAAMMKLGLWTNNIHEYRNIQERRPFPNNLGNLGPEQLADEYAWWTSELGRISELHGVLCSQKVWTDLQVRTALAQARSNTRKSKVHTTDADGKTKKLTQGEVNDIAETDPALMTARNNEALVDSYLAAITPMKDVTIAYLQTLSREITRRGDLQRNRL